MMTAVGVAVVSLLLLYVQGSSSLFYQKRYQRYYGCMQGVTQDHIGNLTSTMANMSRFYNQLLPQILVPRLPGTLSHLLVRQFIQREMQRLGWTVELDQFEDSTPLGPKPFTNIIATLKPTATKRIVFACHYESKLMNGEFLGATDSAVPCTILLDTAFKMTAILQGLQDVTPQFIFFDGEEAFVRWSADDSIYGSRHLAQKWLNEPDPNDDLAANNLENIDLFVLLDLIGGSRLQVPNFFYNTSLHYYYLYQTEYCLQNSRVLPVQASRRLIFDPQNNRHTVIEDDHIPFLHKGVRVLHLISYPFPDVWHELTDDLEHLDTEVIARFCAIFRVFLFRFFTGLI